MTCIELSDDDVHDVLEVLDYRLHELQDELVHTDDRAYRQELRAASSRLDQLRHRLHHLARDVPSRDRPSPIARRRPTPA